MMLKGEVSRPHGLRKAGMSGIRVRREQRLLMLSWVVLAAFAALTMLTGCNTLRGAGQDVENVGDAVKDAVD
jgi:predicted small secreted protein